MGYSLLAVIICSATSKLGNCSDPFQKRTHIEFKIHNELNVSIFIWLKMFSIYYYCQIDHENMSCLQSLNDIRCCIVQLPDSPILQIKLINEKTIIHKKTWQYFLTSNTKLLIIIRHVRWGSCDSCVTVGDSSISMLTD